jgi:Cu+-exporting ATPase
MSDDLAVVLDVAGTMLRMYRVAKDIQHGILMERVVTWRLIMEKKGRALVVPQIDPSVVASCPPQEPMSLLLKGRERRIEVSCSSSPVSRDDAINILRHSNVRIAEIQEVHRAVQARCPHKYQTTGVIIDTDLNEITHTISTGGIPFPGLREALKDLEGLGADLYVASGDSIQSLRYLAELGIRQERIYPVADPKCKREIVLRLKEKYREVVMVGDGLNDIYALQAADLGVLTVQQDSRPAESLLQAADEIIKDIRDLPGLLEKFSALPEPPLGSAEHIHSSIT